MRIGIMGAMPEEIGSIYAFMTETNIIEHGSRSFHIGKIHHHDVIVVFSRWGKVAAAITATILINEFKIDQLIFTGVAGAAAPQLTIGDVVISKKLYQHDMDARPLMPRYQIPLTNLTFFDADNHLIELAHSVTNIFLQQITQKIPSIDLARFEICQPQCLIGTIATGDQFIYDKVQCQALVAAQPETIAVEMEGAAVAQVCHDHAIAFVVIRTISDNADHTSAIDFPEFILKIARHYSANILQHVLAQL